MIIFMRRSSEAEYCAMWPTVYKQDRQTDDAWWWLFVSTKSFESWRARAWTVNLHQVDLIGYTVDVNR